jgi:hypothetical protein
MNKIIIYIMVAIMSITAFAAESAQKKRVRLTPEERAARRYRRNGGNIEKPISGNYIAIVNPKLVTRNQLDKAVSSIRELLPFQFKQISSMTEADNKAVMKIELVSEDSLDTLTIYPERPGAKINISALKKDSPDENKFALRFTKQIWRALSFALGAGNSVSMFSSVMKPVTSLRDLDRLKTENAAPDGFNQMLEMANKIKLERQGVYTYRQACIEGWAPAPTNDIQKAIWDKVHATPKNPMKIEFDPKKRR